MRDFLDASARAAPCGTYPNSLMASLILSRRAARTESGEFKNRETVAGETSARRATSDKVGASSSEFFENAFIFFSPS